MANNFRNRKPSQAVSYDEEELGKLAADPKNSVVDRRTVLIGVPSLAKWALEADETGVVGGLMKQRVVKFVHELLGSMVFMWFVIFSIYVVLDTEKFTGTTTGTATGIEFGTESIHGTEWESGTWDPGAYVGPETGIEFLNTRSSYRATERGIDSILAGLVQGFGLCLALVISAFWSSDFNPTWTFVTMFYPRVGTPTPGGSSMTQSIWTNVVTGLIKILGQHIGFFAGALLAWLVLSTSFPASTPAQIAANIPGVPGVPLGDTFTGYLPTTTQAFVFEMLGSMMQGLLLMVIQFNPASTLSKIPQLTMAFVQTALVIIGFPITGASYNWGRYFGHAVVAFIAGGTFGSLWWLYLLAPLAGHGLAAALFIFVYNF